MVNRIICSLLSLFFFLTTVSSYANFSGSYVVEGKIGTYSEPAKMFMTYKTPDNRIIEDSCSINNGYFSFEGTTEYPFPVQMYLAKNGNKNEINREDALFFYLEPGRIRIDAQNNLRSAAITGSKTQDLYMIFQQSLSGIQQKADRIQQTYNNASQDKQNDSLFTDSLNIEYEKVKSEYNNAAFNFILTNRDEMLGVYMLLSHLETYPNDINVEPIFNTLSEKIRQTAPGEKLHALIRLYKTLNEGETAPEFTAPDVAGRNRSLSDFKGKYILLVFWSPTCHHCLSEIPHLKKYYELYKNKGLEIISFALADTAGKEEWTQTVNENEMNWTNLSDLKGWESKVLESYKVYGVPKNYLINPEGIIIGKELYGKNLYEKMNELFEKTD